MAQVNRLIETYGEELTRLNGFSDSQLNFNEFIDAFVGVDTVADASIDGNANISSADIVTLENEMSKPQAKLLAFNKIFHELVKRYGLSVANEWLTREWIGELYLHDAASSTFKSYCYSYDLTRLANEGLFFLRNFNNKAPEHLTTYTDFVGEYISYTANRSSGAKVA